MPKFIYFLIPDGAPPPISSAVGRAPAVVLTLFLHLGALAWLLCGNWLPASAPDGDALLSIYMVRESGGREQGNASAAGAPALQGAAGKTLATNSHEPALPTKTTTPGEPVNIPSSPSTSKPENLSKPLAPVRPLQPVPAPKRVSHPKNKPISPTKRRHTPAPKKNHHNTPKTAVKAPTRKNHENATRGSKTSGRPKINRAALAAASQRSHGTASGRKNGAPASQTTTGAEQGSKEQGSGLGAGKGLEKNSGKGSGHGLGSGSGNGSGSSGVRVLRRVSPSYPAIAKKRRIEGNVLVAFTVTPSGEVENPHVISAEPPGIFDTSALRAIRKWKFRPAYRNGRSVASELRLPVVFQLR